MAHKPSGNPHSAASNPLLIQTIVLEPGELITVELGRFRYSDTPPQFRVDYPDHDTSEPPSVINQHDVPLDQLDGSYRLIRLFQSYGQGVHRVSVQFCTAADRRRCLR
jgi:hypothetical protein